MGERDGEFVGVVLDGALVDRVALGALTSLVPPDVVDEVLVETKKTEQRKRRLPARVVVYFVLACCLYFGDDYDEVMRKLVGNLKAMGLWSDDWEIPSTGSLSKARARLGVEPLSQLFSAVAQPVGTPGIPGSFLAGFRLMSLDGTKVHCPDTPANAEEFGYAGTRSKNPSAFPTARVLALAECGTRTIIDAAIGGWDKQSEQALARELTGRLAPGMLLIMDSQSWGSDLWKAFTATGCDLLWRVQATWKFPVLRHYPDGSWLSVLLRSTTRRARFDAALAQGRIDPDDLAWWGDPVRVIEYTVTYGEKEETITLICSVQDHTRVTAIELAGAYHERWEAETGFREIKTTQKGTTALLRSRSPEMVKQEIWSLLLTHFLINSLIADTAANANLDPDRLSFTKALRIIRRQITDQAGFSP